MQANIFSRRRAIEKLKQGVSLFEALGVPFNFASFEQKVDESVLMI